MNPYRFVRTERRDGILQMTLHTDGGPFQWNLDAQVIATRLAARPDMLLRYTRAMLTHPLRRVLEEGVPYYLAMETLSTLANK